MDGRSKDRGRLADRTTHEALLPTTHPVQHMTHSSRMKRAMRGTLFSSGHNENISQSPRSSIYNVVFGVRRSVGDDPGLDSDRLMICKPEFTLSLKGNNYLFVALRIMQTNCLARRERNQSRTHRTRFGRAIE